MSLTCHAESVGALIIRIIIRDLKDTAMLNHSGGVNRIRVSRKVFV